MSNKNHTYQIDEFNAETEKEAVGRLGPAKVLYAGLAENILSGCEEPDILSRRIIRNNGKWDIDYTISFSIFYPGNSNQTTVARVSKITEDNKLLEDFYQIPYSEVVPRIAAIFRQRVENNEDQRWFIVRVNNHQLEGWLIESGLMKMSDNVLELLEESETEDENQNENIRNKHRNVVERGEE